jgi:hypothetical protein
VVVSLTACSPTTVPASIAPESRAPASSASASAPPSSASTTGTPRPQDTAAPTESLTEDISGATFGDVPRVDNAWFPLEPGTRWVFEGDANGDEARVDRRVVFVVTDLVKEIAGVRTVVAYERDYNEGELTEAELVFFAQDDTGRVWHLGQYPEEYEDGEFIAAPTWIAGLREAAAGIFMKAEPRYGDPSYSQGWGPEVGWTDRARVFETGSRTCVPAGCYDDVLVIDEFNRDEPDAHQLKYYARRVGNVRVGWAGALEEEQEVLELVEFTQLDPEALAAIRAEALGLEAHAYQVSPDVYGRTSPAEPTT